MSIIRTHMRRGARDIDARYLTGRNSAETLREFSQRAIGIIKQLATTHDNKKIAVVTHGGVLECVYRAANGIGLLPPRDFAIFNASINRSVCNGTAMHISRWGDVAHLTQMALDEVDK